MSLIFTGFYDFEFFGKSYPYHRDWLGFSFWSTYRELEFRHYILSHSRVWEIIIKVGDEWGDKDVYDMVIREMMRKKQHHKENIESTKKKAFIISPIPERGLSIDDYYDIVVNYSVDYVMRSAKAKRLLKCPHVTVNAFADHINKYLEQVRG